MAMLIGKFHRLIGSRIFWIFFSALIIISFVWWSVPGMGKNNAGAPTQRHAGELNGRKISHGEFGLMRAFERLIGDLRNRTVDDDALDKNTWHRIAALEAAQDMGIQAVDSDVTSSITQLGLFQSEAGSFDPAQYQAVLSNIRRRYGIGPADFENFIRQEIVLQRLNSLVFNMVLVAPQEVKDIYQRYSKQYEVDYVELTPDWVADEVKVSDEELQDFYTVHRQRFTIPEQVQVLYTRIPYAAFTNEVEVSEEQINAIYTANQERFVREVDVEQPAEGTNAPTVLTVVTNLTLAEASIEISSAIKLQKARSLAQDKGTEIWVNFQKTNDFTAVAQGLGLQVETSAYFSIDQPVPGIDPTVPMQEFAFSLGTETDEHVTDVMVGSNAVYVASQLNRRASRIPPLDEVKEACRFHARVFHLRKRLVEKSAELHEGVKTQLANGGSFSNIVVEAGLVPQRTMLFSLAGGELQGHPMAEALSASVSYRKAGDLCDLEESPSGTLLAYVNRTADPNWEEYDTMRDFIVRQLSQGRAGLVYNEFLEYLLERGKFESNFVSRDEQADENESDASEQDAESADPAT